MEKIIKLFIWLFSVSAIRYFVIAGIPFLIFYKLLSNKLNRAKIQGRAASLKDFTRDILHSMQTTAVLALIAYVVMYTPLVQYTHVYAKINQYPIWWLWASVPVCLIIHDTYFYWMHRLLHHKKIFKYTHVLHHKSTNPSPWTSYSFHIIESFTEGLVLVVIVLIIPVHPLAILMFTVSAFVINVYGHLGYEILPKGFRKRKAFQFFNTSVHHNLHHSKFNGNYGLYFRVWDRLMGTEHPDYAKEYDRIQQKRFGTKELTIDGFTNEAQA
jgi:lathosterol oxidase